MFGQDLQYALIEIGLQRSRVFQPMLLHELLDLWIGFPLFAVVLITADVDVFVGEQLRHFTQESVKEFVGLFACRIHGWIEDAEPAFNLVRSGPTR